MFDLYNASGRKVATKATDQSGRLTVYGLYPDKYFFAEVTAPAGYLLDKTRHEFSVSVGGTTKVEVTNVRSTVPDCFTSDHYAYIIGYPDGMVRPQGNITRAETMAVVNRVLQRLPRSKENLLPGMITWPDNMDEDAWYYLYVQEATNGHSYERVNGSEHWIDWEETPDWKQYER